MDLYNAMLVNEAPSPGTGLTVTWPGTPVTWGDAPTAAGEYTFLLWYNSSGVLNVLNPGDSG